MMNENMRHLEKWAKAQGNRRPTGVSQEASRVSLKCQTEEVLREKKKDSRDGP